MTDNILSLVSSLSNGVLNHAQIVEHVSSLSQVQGSATPSSVPSQSLQLLARESTQPTQFVSQFSNCSRLNIPQLSGMVDLLTQVCQDEEIRANLNQPSSTKAGNPGNANSPDYRSLRERLLKEVVSSTNAQLVVSKPKIKRVFDNRPNLTSNFIFPNSNNGLNNKTTISCLKGVPPSSQESSLLSELLYTLLGNTGDHIIPSISDDSDLVTFSLDKDIDKSLQSLIQRLLPLASHYSAVVTWCEDTCPEDGRVNQALAAGINLLLSDYTMLICQLEQNLAKGQLTMHQLHHQLQPSKHTMEILYQLVSEIRSHSATGGTTLSILHSRLLHCGSDPKYEKVIAFLTELAAKPFFEILSKWLYRGVIVDPGKDFFVEDHEVVEKKCLPVEYNDDYWEKRYCLKIDKIPTFLSRYADTILRTGKYLNVIQQCDKTAKWPDIVDLGYLPNAEHYQPVFVAAHQFASTTLLQLLLNDRDLIGHLKSVKKYFLMEQGDFINQFLDLCEHELSQAVDCVEPARLESLLEMAARTSSANHDPYKDNLSVALLPYDLEFQMGKIMAIDTADEAEFQSCDTSMLSGLDAFAFGYEVEWPVSLVLNHKALAQYQMLFRHFFYCKHIERLLSDVWITNKQTKFLPGDQFKVYHPAFGLRQKMMNLIQNLSYYMCVEVIEPAWGGLVTAVAECSTIDEVLSKHSDFLNSCLHDCLLSSPQLLATVKKLLCVCSDFALYMDNLTDAVEDFVEDIKRYDLQFNSVLASLLDRISQLGRDNYNEKVLNILHRLDFNGFYTTTIDQFKSTPAGLM